MNKVRCVTNASPIIALSKIGLFQLLHECFDEVYIPNAVQEEIIIKNKHNYYGLFELKKALNEGKVIPYEIKNIQEVERLTIEPVHRGELEAVVAAKELKVDRVILDDNLGRKLAINYGVSPIGTGGVLVIAKELNLIKEVKPQLDYLINYFKFRLSDEVYKKILELANEKI